MLLLQQSPDPVKLNAPGRFLIDMLESALSVPGSIDGEDTHKDSMWLLHYPQPL